MDDLIRVFIGYDESEITAYHTLAHSILEKATQPVAISPVMLSQLKTIFERPENQLASTQFSFSRFLVPYLTNYSGWAVFMDCDMLCRQDITELWQQRDERFAVQVVKHEHKPANATKFNNHVQTRYAKKNWSSVMLMNCYRCQPLTLDYVNNASGLELHQFKWLSSDQEVGQLPPNWNHLVGYDSYDPDCALAHFTEGGPYFSEYETCDYAEEWFATHKRANSIVEHAESQHQDTPLSANSLTPQNDNHVTISL